MRSNFDKRGKGRGHKMAAMAAFSNLARECAGQSDGGPFGDGGAFGFGGPRRGDGANRRRGGPRGPFGGGKGGRGGGSRGGGRGRRGMFNRAELRLVLLNLIADEPRHGYDLIKLLEERSGGAYAPSPGVIYPALAMLADEGLIAEQPGDDQRRRFALTPDGKALIASEAETIAGLAERLDELATRTKKDRAPQIERATINLGTAIRQRMEEGGKDDLVFEIAEILDEAARRIERL